MKSVYADKKSHIHCSCFIVNYNVAPQTTTFLHWIKKLKIPVIIITGIILISYSYTTYYKMQDQTCYKKCSEYHLLGTSEHWDYNDYVIDLGDTIWVDEECYNDWCICIDECRPGLCCDLLN